MVRGWTFRAAALDQLASCSNARYTPIVEFRHAGLRRIWEYGDASRLNPAHAARIARILDDLADADRPADMDFPSRRLHPLAGNRRGTWSIRVSGNWRLTFRFEDGEAVAIDPEDYH